MKVLKDTPFEFAWRHWPVRPPEPSITLVVKATFDVVPGGACSVAEEQAPCAGEVPHDEDVGASLRTDSDLAILKPRGECFVAGTFHAPGGVPVATSVVSFKIGRVARAIAVFGDRHWTGGLVDAPSDPAPVASVLLSHERCFGGPGFDANPAGRGLVAVETPDGARVPLPNFEDPEALVRARGDRPEPASAFPIPPTWPRRAALTGTYDARWQRTRWPWFPDDFDWRFYNAAPPQQQIDGYWKGDEEVAFQNLRPDHPVVRTRLPGIRARCFVVERGGAFREVALNLDTITLDADAGQVLCVWRGVTAAPEGKPDDAFEQVFVTHDPIDAPRSHDECRARMNERLDEEKREEEAFEAEAPGPLPPAPLSLPSEGVEVADDETTTQLPVLRMPPELLAGAAHDTEQLPVLNAAAFASAMGPAVTAQPAEALDEAPAEALPEPPAPPRRDEVRARIERGESLAGEDLTGADLSSMDFHGQDLTGALFARANLAGCVFDGASLREASLAGATLTGASLRDVDLYAADFSDAVARGACFDGAALDEAQFVDADLTGATFREASGNEADFSRARLDRAVFAAGRFEAADFTGATVEDADFSRAFLADATFEEAKGARVTMEECNLSGLRAGDRAEFPDGVFRAVNGANSKWGGARLEGANFALSKLDRADFSAATLVRANLDGCVLKGARFDEAVLTGASMKRSDVFEGSFAGADLQYSDLRGSNLYGAEFWRARTDDCRLELANLAGTKLA